MSWPIIEWLSGEDEGMPMGGFDGYYDDTGHWKRTKFCFMACHRCTCGPPGGVYYNPLFDKSQVQKSLELDPKDPMRGISMENVRR